MVIVRLKVQCRPDRTEELLEAMKALVGPSRAMPGVVHFDLARDVTDPNSLLAIEVFEDRATMDRHDSQPEVAELVGVMQGGALAAPPEWTVFEVASAESPGG